MSEAPSPSSLPGICWAQPDFWGNEQRYLTEALNSTWISGGPFVEQIERRCGELTGSKFAISACNGTAAIHMAYLAMGIQSGDEIVVPGFGFLAAANVALHMNAVPVFTEVDPKTWCMTAETIEPVLTPRTRLIVPVHTYGNVCAMGPIMDLARSRGIRVLEDVAEAFASRYRGRWAGTLGNAGTFSFQATKTITTGEGGLVVTDDPELSRQMALYRSHGMLRKRYFHEVAGHNFRLTNLQAAVGLAQLDRLDQIIEERRRVHRAYSAGLKDVSGLHLQSFEKDVDPVLWAMAVRLESNAFPQGRDAVMEQMSAMGIETRPGFYPPTAMSLYRNVPALPGCEALSAWVISLPTFAKLMDEQVSRICKSLLKLRS